MGYIETIRRKIGHDPLMIVGGSVVIADAEGRVLLQRRLDNGLWAYHGGSLELNERAEDAARRELLEETGLVAHEMKLLGVFSGPEMAHVYPNGDQASIVDIVYLCRDYSGELRPQAEEVTEFAWFDAKNLPENLNPPHKWMLRVFKDGIPDL